MSARQPLRFSVVIPTYQRREAVLNALQALSVQEGMLDFEVVVVVDGSTDGTAAALRELDFPFPLSVIAQSNRGRATACNKGAAIARGELLLFLDDDMEADRNLLVQHHRAHLDGADVVIGHIPLHPESPPGFLPAAVGAWAEQRAEALLERNGKLEVGDFLTGQMSIRRAVFVGIGGFDTAFTREGAFGGEDLDLGRRLLDAGYQINFDPRAISWQRYVVTPRQYLRQWRQGGRASVMLARKHPDQAARIFRRRETLFDRFIGRPLLPLLRAAVLTAASTGIDSPRIKRWFYRVRNLEHFRGIREAGGRPGPRPVRVLCYHSISDLAGAPVVESYGIPPDTFRRQLKLLNRYFRFISADEFARYLRGSGVPRRALLLTFDDCYDDLANAAVPLLREFDAPALAFAVTGKLGGTNDWDAPLGAQELRLLDADELRVVAGGGVAIGSHTRTHQMLNRLSTEELVTELEGSLDDLDELGLGRPLFLAYPHGEHNAEVRRAAEKAGFVGAFTVEPGQADPRCDPYAIPRIEVMLDDGPWRILAKLSGVRRRKRGSPRRGRSGARTPDYDLHS
jgi:GT2 family glycosyltransferase/peptidoglycan/xylan/chitin deacetylase (PgdA/CDA1 family)